MTHRNYKITTDMDNNEKNKLKIIHNTYKFQREQINYEFNKYLKKKYLDTTVQIKFWELFELLDGITDLSDPDTTLPNSIHALQTAEAIRTNGTYPDWFILCGLIHDMGKIIYINGNDKDGTSLATQWAIVGDTFITGCDIPDNIILNEYNEFNKDHKKINMYHNNCGLNNCEVSFGHDEFMYYILKENKHTMPLEAEYIIRYHSLYLYHSSNSYDYLLNDTDIKMKQVVKDFNQFDLYSKNDTQIVQMTSELKTYYSDLVKKYISPNLMIYI